MGARQSRRLFLGGAGVTVALPFLPSALWSRRAGAASCIPPRRFMAWFVPNGMNMADWTPATTDGTSTWDLTPILAPLGPIRKKIAILTGLDHEDIALPPGNAGPGGRAAGTGCFLNMIPVDKHYTDPARISLDQALLPVLNRADCGVPLLPSLQIGVQGDNGLCERAPCEFTRRISWSLGLPLPIVYDPQVCFDQMFAVSATTPDAAQRAAHRKSVLDSVVAQAKSLSVTLSPADRRKLDQHTTLVRNIETRLQRIGKSRLGLGGTSCNPIARPASPGVLNFDRGLTPGTVIMQDTATFLDLMALAFQCDITRAITFMQGNGASENDYTFLGAGPHRAVSQHDGDPSKLAKLTNIGIWEMQQAAALLLRLDGMMESDGQSVLDHTTFYLASDIGDGFFANHWDIPVMLAGGASGALKIDGRHINYIPQMPFPRPLAGPRSSFQTGRVFISILQAHGLMQDTFGMASGGPLPELMR